MPEKNDDPHLPGPFPTAPAELLRSYAEVPYASIAHAEMQPGAMAARAGIAGLETVPLERCRVLELGCGDGINLLATAARHPGARCLGVDLAANNVEAARQAAATLGLANVEFREGDVRALEGLGSFDYVIAHGLLSWIPEDAQAALFALCARSLSPRGLACLSYKTYPGWHRREMVREILRYGLAGLDDWPGRLSRARQLLPFLLRFARAGETYRSILAEQAAEVAEASDDFLTHDLLEVFCAPLTFADFVARARRHDLAYVGDMRHASTLLENQLPPPAITGLQRLTSDPIERQQWLDFLTDRSFRRSLLCKAGRSPAEPAPERLAGLHVSSSLREMPGQGGASGVVAWGAGGEVVLETAAPAANAGLAALAQAWPRTRDFSALEAEVAAQLPPGAERASFGRAVFAGFCRDEVDLFATPPLCVLEAGPRPEAWPLARWLAGRGRQVCNVRIEVVALTPLARWLLPALDGSRDRAELLAWFVAAAREGRVAASGALGPEALRPVLAAALDGALVELARAAMLVA